jgi:hypothetical protein
MIGLFPEQHKPEGVVNKVLWTAANAQKTHSIVQKKLENETNYFRLNVMVCLTQNRVKV